MFMNLVASFLLCFSMMFHVTFQMERDEYVIFLWD
ncbi:hypothetical protein GLYMA_14G057950v4 [Glycine max]|nr:hypothetical protein GLYMA_14G057950v4 [Glycine max]KAH1093239.1 hypothetical protein GYH30_039128 [Glycine max]